MIRFQPDNFREALLRPLAMAAPDAGVYAEIAAPDLRFAAVVILTFISAVVARRIEWKKSPILPLLGYVIVCFALWLFTTGNGRYFIGMLLVVGPLCIALVHWLPFKRNVRAVIAMGLVVLQAILVYDTEPWRMWGLAQWNEEPFFQISLDQQAMMEPATYVTATAISYSLVAPRFPAIARWVNISGQRDPEDVNGRRVQATLVASSSIQLLIPSMPDHMTPSRQPSAAIAQEINGMIGWQKLALQDPPKCRLLPSRGLATQAFKDVTLVKPETLAKFGFWICPLQFPVEAPPVDRVEGSALVNSALDFVEKACPRLFPAVEAKTRAIVNGFVRNYSSTDMKLYVLEGEQVHYKYWRALNPELIGSVSEIVAPSFRMSCDSIRGRSGLPWERKL